MICTYTTGTHKISITCWSHKRHNRPTTNSKNQNKTNDNKSLSFCKTTYKKGYLLDFFQ